jgi:hypothetical protein
MGDLTRVRIKNRNYSGFNLLLPDDDPHSAFDYGKQRFRFFAGVTVTSDKAMKNAVDMLTLLVNLPEDPNSHAVAEFIARYHNLGLGKVVAPGNISAPTRSAPAMSPQDIVEFRNIYRQFWKPSSDGYKSNLFQKLLDPWPVALHSPISGMSGDQAEAYHAAGGATYPYGDYRVSALRINWKTGHPEIVARGPADWLTHAAFKNRKKLRVCSSSECKEGADGGKKLFIANFPRKLSCSNECQRKNDLASGNRYWNKNCSSAARKQASA